MTKIFEYGGCLGLIALSIFFLIAPNTTGEMDKQFTPLQKKSMEVERGVNNLILNIDSLKGSGEKKEVIIQEMLKYLKTNKGQKYVKMLSIN